MIKWSLFHWDKDGSILTGPSVWYIKSIKTWLKSNDHLNRCSKELYFTKLNILLWWKKLKLYIIEIFLNIANAIYNNPPHLASQLMLKCWWFLCIPLRTGSRQGYSFSSLLLFNIALSVLARVIRKKKHTLKSKRKNWNCFYLKETWYRKHYAP